MNFLDQVITNTNNDPEGWFEWCYVGFNWLEAFAWFAFAFYVWMRAWKGMQTQLELWYGMAFLLFGITDIIEVYQLTVGVLLLKILVFLSLLFLRIKVLRLYHPRRMLL